MLRLCTLAIATYNTYVTQLFTCVFSIHPHTFAEIADYLPIHVQLFLYQSGSRRCIVVAIVNDQFHEGRESFYLILRSETPDLIEDRGQTTVTIIDDEGMWCV